MHRDLPIGMFDSGVGGLTVAAALLRELPNETIHYFGDTARCPYGDKTPAEVRQCSVQVCDFLVELGVKLLVVACNTATAVALPDLTARYAIPVVGVVDPGARAAARVTESGRVGMIGTTVTVASGAYERAIKRHAPDVDVFSLACPQFVPLVERGQTRGAQVDRVVRRSLRPLVELQVDTLILGCTHYPHLQAAIQHAVGPAVRLISSADETAREVRSILEERGWLRHTQGEPHRFYTTGTGQQMRTALHQWLGINLDRADVRSVRLHDLSLGRYRSGQC